MNHWGILRKIKYRFRKRTCIWFLVTLFLILPVLGITGCGKPVSTDNGSDSDKNVVIATSFYPMYIMTKNIVREIPGVEVLNITGPITGCLHHYQLTTDDLKRLHRAQILVINGAGMESFLDQVIDQKPSLKIVEASREIPLIKDEHGEENSHIWVSVSLAMKQVQNIADQLASLDPQNGSAYHKNAASYIKELEILRDDMRNQLKDLPNKDIITFHEAFPYFARDFGLRVVAVIEREPGSEPSAAELAGAIKIIQQSGVKAIFVETQYSTKAAETIARETNSKVFTLDPAVTGPDDPGAYLEIMKRNSQVLVEALSDKK